MGEPSGIDSVKAALLLGDLLKLGFGAGDLKALALDQPVCDGAADRAARDQSEGGRGNGNGGSSADPHIDQLGAKGGGRSMPADHRN